jgi:hypothetical protein
MALVLVGQGCDESGGNLDPTAGTEPPAFAPCPEVREDAKARVTLDCAQSLVDVEVVVPDMSPDYFHDGFEFDALFGDEVGVMYGSTEEDKYLYLRITRDRIIGELSRTESMIPGSNESVFFPSESISGVDAFWVVGDRGFELYWSEQVDNGRDLALTMAAQTIQ